MAYCRQCGAELRDGVKFCPACGTPVAPAAQQPRPAYDPSGDPAFDPSGCDPQDVQQNKVMAILSYFGILVLVPVFTAKESKFARFHANQGMVLMICEVAYSIIYRIVTRVLLAVSSYLSFVVGILGLVYLLFFVLAILGIVNAANGKMNELPVIGKYRIVK